MNQTQWWPIVVFLLVLSVPTIFIAIRQAFFPSTVRLEKPIWLVDTEQIVRASSERFERATVVALDPIVLLAAPN
jgi:hypothetical protein